MSGPWPSRPCAGFAPRCLDLFADADLCRACPTRRLTGRYPQAFLDASEQEEAGPWLYTGGLENWPDLVARLAERRPLWGNDAASLRQVRDPWHVGRVLQDHGLPVLRLSRHPPGSDKVRWLAKPLRGAGGTGIHFADTQTPSERPGRPLYYQEYLEGEPVAAIFLGDGRTARLLGATRQLIGEPWLRAGPFWYCGSVGPLDLPAAVLEPLDRIGKALVEGCGLRGLFGVDGVLRDGTFWLVEVNPRYTASVEVLEYATGLRAWRNMPRSSALMPAACGLAGLTSRLMRFQGRSGSSVFLPSPLYSGERGRG